MKLFYNQPSPYARKVLVFLLEKNLAASVELVAVDPWRDPPELLAATPLAKVPALLTDDRLLIVESSAICTYLDCMGGRMPLAPAEPDLLSRAGLAHGIIDAAFGIVIERRRPSERQWLNWTARQERAIRRSVPLARRSHAFDLGDITLACALAYMDYRLPEIDWRIWSPDLSTWLEEVERRPSMEATRPAALMDQVAHEA